jgi:hypothetical protein
MNSVFNSVKTNLSPAECSCQDIGILYTELNLGWLEKGSGNIISHIVTECGDLGRNFKTDQFRVLAFKIGNMYMTTMTLAKRAAIIGCHTRGMSLIYLMKFGCVTNYQGFVITRHKTKAEKVYRKYYCQKFHNANVKENKYNAISSCTNSFNYNNSIKLYKPLRQKQGITPMGALKEKN